LYTFDPSCELTGLSPLSYGLPKEFIIDITPFPLARLVSYAGPLTNEGRFYRLLLFWIPNNYGRCPAKPDNLLYPLPVLLAIKQVLPYPDQSWAMDLIGPGSQAKRAGIGFPPGSIRSTRLCTKSTTLCPHT